MNYYWIITALSIVGVVLNIKKNKAGFVVWIFTNAAWMVIDFRAELYPQAALFAVYLALAIWGLIEWRQK